MTPLSPSDVAGLLRAIADYLDEGTRPVSDGAAGGHGSPPPSTDSRVPYYLTGPTYPHREQLKSFGWSWNASEGRKRYEQLLTVDEATQAQKAVLGLSSKLAVNRA